MIKPTNGQDGMKRVPDFKPNFRAFLFDPVSRGQAILRA
jgi:hypothetical protein